MKSWRAETFGHLPDSPSSTRTDCQAGPMPPSPLDAVKVHVTWEFYLREIEMHERRYLAILAASFSGALASLASVLLEKVPAAPGVALTALLLLLAGYVHLLIRRLPARLQRAMAVTLTVIESLKDREDE